MHLFSWSDRNMPVLSRMTAAVVVLAAALAAGAAFAQESKPGAGVSVSKPWARATPGGSKVGVAYLELSAAPGTTDKLVAARSPVAGAVELHTHSHVDGVMKMRRIDDIAIEPGKSVTLKPGGLHIMLMDLKQPLKEGETIDLTLVFEKAGEVAVKVPVLKVGAAGPDGATGGGGHGKH
jgi:copper(I)-binding protein